MISLYHIHNTLQNKFLYYQALAPTEQARFIARVKEFSRVKEFIGREELVLTEDTKVLIAASAIQLTFGLDSIGFDKFTKILVYPKEYYNRMHRQYHKGEVNPLAGCIVLSQEAFEEGYKDPNDKINLGLHEMGHALYLDARVSDSYDRFFSEYFKKWWLVALDEFKNMQRGGEHFLRDYAGTNSAEFFSVCVEHFFEAPMEFKKRLPEIYKHLCILLNQNPAEKIESSTNSNTRGGQMLNTKVHTDTVVFETSHDLKFYVIFKDGIGIQPIWKFLGKEMLISFDQIISFNRIYGGEPSDYYVIFYLSGNTISRVSFPQNISPKKHQLLEELLLANKIPIGDHSMYSG